MPAGMPELKMTAAEIKRFHDNAFGYVVLVGTRGAAGCFST
jgi:hypothetical protein